MIHREKTHDIYIIITIQKLFMPYQNIIYIHGNNSFLVDREKTGLLGIFEKKYGKDAIEMCPIHEESNISQYIQHLQTPGLFGGKRLFYFFGGKNTAPKTKKKSGNHAKIEIFLEEFASQLSCEDFCIFANIAPGESHLIAWLTKNATLRTKNISWQATDWEPYTDLNTPHIHQVLQYYKTRESLRDKYDTNPFLGHSIAHTLFLLETLDSAQVPITNSLIDTFSHGYEGAKIFDCTQAITEGNIPQAISLIRALTDAISAKNYPIFFASFLGILRQSLYILSLRDAGKSSTDIASLLPNIHPFVLKKNLQSQISAQQLGCFFQKILFANIAYKKGKGMNKNELGQLFSIEVALLELKN